MKRAALNAFLAFVCLLLQSNIAAAYGFSAVCHFAIIAITVAGVCAMPMVSSSVAILILAFICDALSSGPTGLCALLLVLLSMLSRAFMSKFRSERLIFVVVCSAVSSALFDALTALSCALYYQNTVFGALFLSLGWKNALLTALASIPFLLFLQQLDKWTDKRRKSELS